MTKEKMQEELLDNGVTNRPKSFSWLCKNAPHRVGIVAEGDSWFSYPRKYLLIGPNSNLVDHIVTAVRGKDKVNLLRMASSGDEATGMISDSQKHALAKIFRKNSQSIKLILFSGGGNDVVGRWDMERLLNAYKPGFGAADCINQERFARKLQRVVLAYKELIELKDQYCPDAVIVTHTYDKVVPSSKGFRVLWGLRKFKPWIQPYLERKGILPEFHTEIVEILLGGLRVELTKLASNPEYKNGFVVVDTYGTLDPGNPADWKNEIHPTGSGFEKICKKYYGAMQEIVPDLPPF